MIVTIGQIGQSLTSSSMMSYALARKAKEYYFKGAVDGISKIGIKNIKIAELDPYGGSLWVLENIPPKTKFQSGLNIASNLSDAELFQKQDEIFVPSYREGNLGICYSNPNPKKSYHMAQQVYIKILRFLEDKDIIAFVDIGLFNEAIFPDLLSYSICEVWITSNVTFGSQLKSQFLFKESVQKTRLLVVSDDDSSANKQRFSEMKWAKESFIIDSKKIIKLKDINKKKYNLETTKMFNLILEELKNSGHKRTEQ